MRVWITRGRPEAEATAARLAALGHEALISSVLEIKPLYPEVVLAGLAGVAFTSANGARNFARLTEDRSLPVYAVGEHTAAAAREAGFSQVAWTLGDVDTLAGLIAAARPKGPILHAAAVVVARPLRPQGVEMRSLAVYESLDRPPPPLDGVEVVMTYSPRGSALAAAAPGATRLMAVCISPATAAPLIAAGLPRVLAAAQPSEASMLACLAELAG